LWRHEPTGSVAVWQMDGAITTKVINVSPKAPLPYRLVGVDDFNADGKADLLWTNDTSRDLSMWIAGTDTLTATSLGTYPVGWEPVSVGDINRDSRADLHWRHIPTGSFAYWVMDGVTTTKVVNIQARAPSGYSVVSYGDFNGDGLGDIAWTSNALDLWIWLGDGTNFNTIYVANYPNSWTPAK